MPAHSLVTTGVDLSLPRDSYMGNIIIIIIIICYMEIIDTYYYMGIIDTRLRYFRDSFRKKQEQCFGIKPALHWPFLLKQWQNTNIRIPKTWTCGPPTET